MKRYIYKPYYFLHRESLKMSGYDVELELKGGVNFCASFSKDERLIKIGIFKKGWFGLDILDSLVEIERLSDDNYLYGVKSQQITKKQLEDRMHVVLKRNGNGGKSELDYVLNYFEIFKLQDKDNLLRWFEEKDLYKVKNYQKI